MATKTIPSTRILYTRLASLPGDMDKAVFSPMATEITRLLVAEGETIPKTRASVVLAKVGQVVMSYFVGSDGRSAFAENGVTALAAYPRTLNRYLAQIQADVVLAHAQFMRANLPDDLITWLSRATIRETVNPEPSHQWLDKRGYSLSDRIWQNGEATRRRLDAMLSDGIRQGTPSIQLSREMEAFLLPTRTWRRTNKPYGRDASFEAMRLARTEISLAHSRATFLAAQANPFTDSMDWRLSARHPKRDICDTLATIGMDGQRIREPYPLETAPQVVSDSHPLCLCANLPAVTRTSRAVQDDLYTRMRAGLPAPLTPLAPRAFLVDLVGEALFGYLFRNWWEMFIPEKSLTLLPEELEGF